MAKIKLRFREEILSIIKGSNNPVSLKSIVKALARTRTDKTSANFEKIIANELRYLVRLKEIERGQGNLFRIRPARLTHKEKPPQRKHSHRFELDFNEDPISLQEVRASRSKRREQIKLTGKVTKNTRGFAFVSPENPPEHIKEDIFLNPEEAEDLFTGDIVEIELDNIKTEKGYNGRLLKILRRGIHRLVARYCKNSPYSPATAEVDSKDLSLEIVLQEDKAFKNLEDGSAILVEVLKIPKAGEPAKGKIISFIADSMNSVVDDPHIIYKHNLKETFPDEVIQEASSFSDHLKESDYNDRQDLRKLPFITIDGADARDFDDAVLCKKIENNHYKLYVAIADVAHYVRPGTAIDKEAYERGTSVYFPHRVLPMIPERLSNGLCSLVPNEDRLALVAEIEFDRLGRKIHQTVYEAVFKSHKRCIYEDLQRYFDFPLVNSQDYSAPVRESLNDLHELYLLLKNNRKSRGSVDLDLPEVKVKVNKESGDVESIIRVNRVDTHKMIEEFMIAANEAVTEFATQKKLDFIYRVHETPELDSVKKFFDVAKTLQVNLNAKWMESISPKLYQNIVHEIEKSATPKVLHFLLLRSMKQAYYSNKNLKHFGLASDFYTHFTSPIRRYPDLIAHRVLKAFLHKNKKEAKTIPGSIAQSIEEAAAHCSVRERLAAEAERELIKIKQVRFAEKHLGEEFVGTIVGMNPRGAYVEIDELNIEGFVPLDNFGRDIVFNEKTTSLSGKRTGTSYIMGQKINVQIVRTNPHQLQIELSIIEKNSVKKSERKTITKPGLPTKRDFWIPEDFES
ncbi:MAG: ribonuclease R [Oligoflexia bacterium]|nr:ribonuclease R [Oligoflexia bacterium]